MATRQNNTMQEGLHQLLSSLAQLKAAPDANLEFLASIESAILSKLREPMQQAAQAMAQAGGVLPPGMGQQLGAAQGLAWASHHKDNLHRRGCPTRMNSGD